MLVEDKDCLDKEDERAKYNVFLHGYLDDGWGGLSIGRRGYSCYAGWGGVAGGW